MYQLLEQELTQKKARTLYKIPEIEKTFKAVELLIQRRDKDESVSFWLHAQASCRCSATTSHNVPCAGDFRLQPR